MRSLQVRGAVLVGALLACTVPMVAGAVAPHLTCGPKQTGRWEQIPVRAFQPISGLESKDHVAAYSLDPGQPQDVAVTNGVRIQVSSTHGCAWANSYAFDPAASIDQPFVGAASSVVSLALLKGRVLAAVQEGTGASSRPHLLRYNAGSWSVANNGLPAQGSPRLLRAGADGRTAYLTISPNGSGGSDTDTPPLPIDLPDLGAPGTGPGQTPTGLLYGTEDAGETWTLRTPATSLPGGGSGFSQLAVDPYNPDVIYGIIGGRLVISRDGGTTYLTPPGEGFTAVTAIFGGGIAAFDAEGHGFVSYDGGTNFFPIPAPKGITSVAYRDGDSALMAESNGVLQRVELGTYSSTRPRTAPEKVPARPRKGSMLGDVSFQSSFHAIAGHSLLRYVDPPPPSALYPPAAIGDARVAPPIPGVVLPPTRDVVLQLGQTRTEEFLLDLPKNPTPLDLFFLVDVSTSMTSYIENLKANLHKVVKRLTDAKVDLKVGLAALGTAPAKGEEPYPESYAFPPTVNPQTGQTEPGPTYHKPRIYQIIRKMDDTGPRLQEAIDSITLETNAPRGPNSSGSYHEGHLLALEQAITGSGVKTQQDDEAGLNTYSAVAPGQEAGFRPNPDVRRIIVLASDETFDVPYGTPQKPGSTVGEPLLDYSRTLKILNDAKVDVFGITAGSPDSVYDMTIVAEGTGAVSPPGGVSCGGEPEQRLDAGAPLVCSQEGDFSAIIGQVLSQLVDRQDAHLMATNQTPVLKALNDISLRGLDVKQRNQVPFSVTVTCAGVSPGTYQQDIDAVLRSTRVGTARLFVTCVPPLIGLGPIPPAGAIPPPPAKPAVQPPVPPPAPPPAAQPQPQPQANINPLAVGVTQEQQEFQLALALNNALQQEEREEVEQLAMVDRRTREQVQAFGVLMFAMTTCAGLGLARLRTRTQLRVRSAR